jgi:hypothetical protein
VLAATAELLAELEALAGDPALGERERQRLAALAARWARIRALMAEA